MLLLPEPGHGPRTYPGAWIPGPGAQGPRALVLTLWDSDQFDAVNKLSPEHGQREGGQGRAAGLLSSPEGRSPGLTPFAQQSCISSRTLLPSWASLPKPCGASVLLWYKMKPVTSPEPLSPLLGLPVLGGGEHGLWEARVTEHSGSWGSEEVLAVTPY